VENNIQIDFQILDTKLSPKEITALLDIIPDDEIKKGARNTKLNLPRQNIWSLRSHTESDCVSDHWLELKSKLFHSHKLIKEIIETGKSKFTILFNSEARFPSIIIPPEMSKFAGYINAEIDIDSN